MLIILEGRAEVALRSLSPKDAGRVMRAIHDLGQTKRELMFRSHNIKKLILGRPDKDFFVYRASARLRLVLSFEGDACTVEDILDRSRLERYSGVRRQG
jgi:hypothetical protein